MNYASIVRVLAFIMLILAGSAMLPVLVAVIAGETDQVVALSVTAISIAVLASSVLLLTPKPKRKARPGQCKAVSDSVWNRDNNLTHDLPGPVLVCSR